MKHLATILLSILPFTVIATPEILPEDHPSVHETLTHCFPFYPQENISLKPLKGGLSLAKLYKIEIDERKYVLRILQSQEINDQDSLELFCLTEASKKGLSPQIIYISPDSRTVIMDFIEGKTLTIKQANLPENVFKIARTLYETHQITGHCSVGESLLSKSKRCALVLNDHLASKAQIKHACELIHSYSLALKDYDYPRVRVHGDMNPRNIFLTNDKVLLIDWAETTMEDPFYDLSYFSLKADYDEENERLLLTSYLGRPSNENEWKRYQLHKKIHHAFWSLTDLYLANEELKKHPDQQINKENVLNNWNAYQESFADSPDELPAQFFYDLSRLNYLLAQ